MKRNCLILAVVVTGLLGATGCGGDDATSTTTTAAATTITEGTTTTGATTTTTAGTTTTAATTTTTQPDLTDEALDQGTAAIEGYLAAFEDNDFRGMGAFATGAAAAYADYLLAASPLSPTLSTSENTVTWADEPEAAELLTDGRFQLGGAAQVTQGGEVYAEMTDFVVNRDEAGQLIVDSWTRDGYAMEQLVHRGGGESDTVEVPGVAVTVAFVWRTPTGDAGVFNLCVILTLDNQRDNVVNVYSFNAAFVSTSSRRQHEANENWGPSEIQPGSIADLFLLWGVLDDIAEGGRVILEVVDAETYDSVSVEVPIPPIPG